MRPTYIQKYFLNCCVGGSIDTLAYTSLNKKYGVTANESDSTVSELQRHLHSPSRRRRHKLYLGSSTFLLGSTVRTTQVRTVNQQGVSTQLYFVPPPKRSRFFSCTPCFKRNEYGSSSKQKQTIGYRQREPPHIPIYICFSAARR